MRQRGSWGVGLVVLLVTMCVDSSAHAQGAPYEQRQNVVYAEVHGTGRIEQSHRFVTALRDAGVRATLTVKPGGAHPWPTLREDVAVLADWFHTELANPQR